MSIKDAYRKLENHFLLNPVILAYLVAVGLMALVFAVLFAVAAHNVSTQQPPKGSQEMSHLLQERERLVEQIEIIDGLLWREDLYRSSEANKQ